MTASLFNHLMRICNHVAQKTRGHFSGPELLGAAYEGWRDAVGKFKRGTGASFVTYSDIRIRGTVWDFIRSFSFWDLRGPARAVSMSDEAMQIAAENKSAAEILNDEQTADALWKATMGLPDEWRRVVQGHYYQGLTMVQIGAMRGVSGSRISQINRRAIKRLRAVMA